MTLPQVVQDAVNELDAVHDQRFAPWRNQWQTIRAELHRLTSELKSSGAEIDELVRALTMCTDRAKLAESRLEAANALLRERLSRHNTMLLTEPPQDAWKYYRMSERIQSHLQGAGDEA